MPKVYNTYKMNKIYANISELRTELSKNEYIDLYEVLDEFSYNNNVSTLVLDKNTANGMSNIVYSSERQELKEINIPAGNSIQKPNDFKFEANRDKLGKEKINFNDKRVFGNADNIVNEVYIKSLDKYCILRVHVYVKPIEEATTIVSLFFPFAILVSLVMALLISTYYSRVFSLTNIINEITYELKFFIEEKNINIQIELTKDIIVEGDSNLLKKAFINIIKNAITYTPSGERIIIKGNLHKITVENTGITIEKKELEKVFNAFYRVDKSRNRKTGGTGLGLYIVKTIFDKHENIKYKMDSKENSVEFIVEF